MICDGKLVYVTQQKKSTAEVVKGGPYQGEMSQGDLSYLVVPHLL